MLGAWCASSGSSCRSRSHHLVEPSPRLQMHPPGRGGRTGSKEWLQSPDHDLNVEHKQLHPYETIVKDEF